MKKRFLTMIVALILVAMALCLYSCASPEKSIVGTWKHETTILGVATETTYTFNEDGSGTKSNMLDIDFKYHFTEDKLVITTSTLGIKNTEEYSFEFDGDKLVLTNEKDTMDLKKVK